MNISETFIRRPIATSLLMAAIALFGVVAYRALPISDLPNVDYPTIFVGANLPGGDPGTMASAVASPLERQFTTIAGVDEMTSSSQIGSSNVVLQFDLNRRIDSAAVDVQTAIAAAMPLLPAGLTAPPSFRKVNPAEQPILHINLTSDTLEMSKVDEYAEDILAPRISMVGGVSQVTVQGAAKFAVRVQVDPNKLQAQKIGINEVDQALQNWNVNLPTGQLFGPEATYNIVARGLHRFRLLSTAEPAPYLLGEAEVLEDPPPEAGPRLVALLDEYLQLHGLAVAPQLSTALGKRAVWLAGAVLQAEAPKRQALLESGDPAFAEELLEAEIERIRRLGHLQNVPPVGFSPN